MISPRSHLQQNVVNGSRLEKGRHRLWLVVKRLAALRRRSGSRARGKGDIGDFGAVLFKVEHVEVVVQERNVVG